MALSEEHVAAEHVAADIQDQGAETGTYSLWREDLIGGLTALVLILGLFLDGWNHINLQDGALGGFFTPWHAMLYTGFTLATTWVLSRPPHLYHRRMLRRDDFHSLFGVTLRYPLAIVGVAIATVGLLGDIVWHTAFGEEIGVARVIAPFHLLLFSGAALLVSAAFRSGWHSPDHFPARLTFANIVPPLLSLSLVTALVAFMFQWLSAFVDWTPGLVIGRVPAELASDTRVMATVEFAGVARILMTTIVLLGPVLLALRRWQLPMGSVTAMWTLVALLMSALTNFDLGGAVPAAFIGGLLTDWLIKALCPMPTRCTAFHVISGLAPIFLWVPYFLFLAVVHDIRWPLDLWIGTVGLSSVLGVALSFVVSPIPIPAGTWEHLPA